MHSDLDQHLDCFVVLILIPQSVHNIMIFVNVQLWERCLHCTHVKSFCPRGPEPISLWLAIRRAFPTRVGHTIHATAPVSVKTDLSMCCKHKSINHVIPFQNLQPGKLPALIQQWDRNLGDIILGMPVIQQACIADAVTLKDRLPVIVTHALCHLVGYHHQDQRNFKLVSYPLATFINNNVLLSLDAQTRTIYIGSI